MQNELYSYLSQGDIFVHPSIEEGLSMVQLEAMSCGLPLICTTNTGGSDVIREGIDGFEIPIRDVDKIKEKISFFYNNPDEQKKMSISAKSRAKEFTWNNYGSRMVAEYNKILEIDK